MHGWVILDKPLGISSADAVAKAKKILKPSKIGHAGTLDPLASGVLPLALGEATKTVSLMMDASKAYEVEVTWGEERATDDAKGEVTQTSAKKPKQEQIEKILPEFTGHIEQMPPDYSAIKVGGKRAYKAAVEGKPLELKTRRVRVDSLKIVSHNESTTQFVCYCGKGTYIRSLARDMGRKLGCFGYISALRRIKVGNFAEFDAISLEKLEELVYHGDLGFIKPVESVLDDILAITLNRDEALKLSQGQQIFSQGLPDGATVAAMLEGKLVAICEVAGASVKSKRGFNQT
jgi:tRNA pseudouridine55 synthase